MAQLAFTDWLAILSAIGVIVALISNLRGMREKDERKASELSEMRTDIKHIRGQVDKTETVMSDIKTELTEIRDRVTRVEESNKSAHQRIDKLEDCNLN